MSVSMVDDADDVLCCVGYGARDIYIVVYRVREEEKRRERAREEEKEEKEERGANQEVEMSMCFLLSRFV